MASESGVLSATATLGAGTADTVTLTSGPGLVEVTHHGNVSNPIYARGDGTAAVAAADENQVILPGQSLVVKANTIADGTSSGRKSTVSLISAGAATYTVAAV